MGCFCFVKESADQKESPMISMGCFLIVYGIRGAKELNNDSNTLQGFFIALKPPPPKGGGFGELQAPLKITL